MKISEVRKTIAAIVGGVATLIPQILASGVGLIPQSWVPWLTLITIAATTLSVYLVPNEKKTPMQRIEDSWDALEPHIPILRQWLQEELRGRISPPVVSRARLPEAVSEYPFKD